MNKILSSIKGHKVVTIIAVVLLAYGAYVVFGTTDTAPVATTKTETAAVIKGTLRVTVSGSGQIEAESQVDLKPVAAGDAIEVTSVAVKNDQEVKKGQLIATIDSEDALRDVRQQELSLKSAQIKMQQTEKEYAARNEDETLVRRSQEVSVKQQQLALQKSLSKLSDYSIRAPFDGIVTGLDVDGGDTISQTAVLASVITKEMKAVISLNEVDVVKVKVNDTARLSLDALPGVVLLGKIIKVDTIGTATQGVVSYGAEVALAEQNAALKPGMSVTADIVTEEKQDVLIVPNEALTLEEGKTSVRVLASPDDQGAAIRGQKREVTTGITDNVSIEILSGLKENDRVIVSIAVSGANPTAPQGNVLNSLFRGGNNRSR